MNFKKILLTVFILTFIGVFNNTNLLTVKASGWGFTKNNYHQVPDIGIYKEIIRDTNTYFVGTNPKEVYLTFDAGYDNGNLPKILDILYNKKVKATFFITGDFINRFPELVIRMVNEGHLVANHSNRHLSFNKLSKEELKQDLLALENKFFLLTHIRMLRIVRPPAGEFDRKTLENLKDLGYKTIFWSIAFKDWEINQQQGVEYSYNSVMNNLHGGAIILLHSVSKSNQEALDSIIDGIISQEYEFKLVSEI